VCVSNAAATLSSVQIIHQLYNQLFFTSFHTFLQHHHHHCTIYLPLSLRLSNTHVVARRSVVVVVDRRRLPNHHYTPPSSSSSPHRHCNVAPFLFVARFTPLTTCPSTLRFNHHHYRYLVRRRHRTAQHSPQSR
jgi:hypothetical protein